MAPNASSTFFGGFTLTNCFGVVISPFTAKWCLMHNMLGDGQGQDNNASV
jgi:hypothetical protein